MRDLGDVCGTRNTQFEQEFLDLFRAETLSAYDERDRIGDFCRRGLSGGTRYSARREIFYPIQSPLAPHELMPSHQ